MDEETKPRQSKVDMMQEMLDKICKKHGFTSIEKIPNRGDFTVSFKRPKE